MPFKQVVVVTKFHPSDLRKKTRHVHRATLKKVLNKLDALSIRHELINRNHLKKTIHADLVIAVGGDGTVLATSHFLDKSPLFAINSAPQTSTGFFCLAKPANFSRHLETILSGRKKYRTLPRLEVYINRKRFPCLALNEFLFASRLQGDTARYRIKVGKRFESQKSSGIWVSTGAGSTAAIYSAGGKKISPFSDRLQYLVREPFRYPKNHYSIIKGFLNPGEKITIISEMQQGMIFMDGAKIYQRIPQGARITVRGATKPLRIFL